MKILDIINAIRHNHVKLSRHSLEEAENDNLDIHDIYLSVIEEGEIIENYPDAYPLPACLILGWNRKQEPIHTVWGYNKNTQIAKLITVYRPNSEYWINWRIRQ